MTTAHRPTFRPAIGGSEQGGNKMLVHSRSYHSKDLPAYLILKMRKPGQGTQEELANTDFKSDLLKREQEGKRQRELKALGVSETSLAIQSARDVQEPQLIKRIKANPTLDADNQQFMESSEEEDQKRQQQKPQVQKENSESDSESSDDDDELLLREYEKVKQQREEEEKRKIKEKQEYVDQNQEEQLINGNQLLVNDDYSLKKKWHEDTIFKNQSRLEVREKQRFINDAVRSDFHRKFLNKYIMM